MKTTRRTFLGGAAAASLPVTAGTCVAVTAIQVEAASPAVVVENPDLLAAYVRLQDAQAELHAAKDALEWIADEWRHLWPLAPEELLLGANANSGGCSDGAERDIVGRFLVRDTSVLCARFSKRQRQEIPTSCFFVMNPDDAAETLEALRKRTPGGRSDKALAKSRADLDAAIERFQHKLVLAQEYETKTARLREAAGVDAAKRRVNEAETRVAVISAQISKIPAFTHEGLVIKADAISASGIFEALRRSEGVIPEMARFIEQVIAMGGRTSA
ncbi:hypothetical protein [Agrobacterium tumefaciens]|uniref:hypothetical protein n=1 Tax=Agrobacterium tumefaciens TaxID=358 RepID=UPI0021D1E770|nr:hypothetical protein [Agrobacterium tumefaciens]UXT11264.1 hypothetical protein FY141_00570 [Agrobacterium tumefaciens]UXT31964.1 hypothetical protein FY138_00565 [Agrobacterium tumefaciens]UXT72019.1 hypothetical protein FY132_00570 [Agrobacterium tumefaciens]